MANRTLDYNELPNMPLQDLYPFEFQIVIQGQAVAVVRVFSTDAISARAHAERETKIEFAERLIPTFTVDPNRPPAR